MPYSRRIAEVIQSVYPRSSEGHALLPEAVTPVACRRMGCRMDIRRAGIGGVWFVHDDGLKQDEYLIPMAWLDDIDKDLWAELVPWLTSLHDAPSD